MSYGGFISDFHKIDGFQIFPIVLQHEEADLRSLGSELIAVLVQNNPYCQNAVLRADLLPMLLELLDKDEIPTVRIKALYAISCEFSGFRVSLVLFQFF